MSLITDQQQCTNKSTALGFGQNAMMRYRGQVFTPTQARVDSVLFYCQFDGGGTVGFKVHFYNVDQTTNLPTTEIYSFTVAASSYTQNKFNRFTLPVPITNLTPGTKYCFFLAPWNTGSNTYSDYYRDLYWSATTGDYTGGPGLENFNGTWSTNAYRMFFQLGYEKASPTVGNDYSQPALPNATKGGWPFNSIDMQIVTKQYGWNQGSTARSNEYQQIISLPNITHIAIGAPYDNVAKLTVYANEIHALGKGVFWRAHWLGWEGDESFTQHVGRQEYLDRAYQFIIDNASLFRAGDLYGMCVEPSNIDYLGNYTFRTPETSGGTFDMTKYKDFVKDQVRYANAAFTAIGLGGQIHTWAIAPSVSLFNLQGQTLSGGSTGNAGGIDDAFFVAYLNSICAIDHYAPDSIRDGNSYYTAYNGDIDKIHTALPSCKIAITEMGYHTTTSVQDGEQLGMYDRSLTALRSKSYVICVNAWVHMASGTASLWNDSGGAIVAGGRRAVEALRKAFSGGNANRGYRTRID